MPRYRPDPVSGHWRARKRVGLGAGLSVRPRAGSVRRALGAALSGHRLPRAALSAAGALVLVLANVGGSYAFYNAKATAVTGGTITAGVAELQLDGAIATVYTSAQPASSVAALSVENTGDAPLDVELAWMQSSGALSPSLVALALWANPGTSAASCATTPPGTASTGTLAIVATGALIPLPLAAGQSVQLCALTSMSSGSIAANIGKSLTGAFAALGTHGSWTAEDTAPAFTQSVQGSPVNTSAWYRLWSARNPASCLEKYSDGHYRLVRQDPCSGSPQGNELWRFTQVSGGYQVKNKETSTWWQVTSAASGQPLRLGTATGSLAAWIMTTADDGTLRFSLVADPSLCVAATGTPVDVTAPLQLAACDPDSESQKFATVMLGEVEPTLIDPLTCSDDGGGNNGNAYLSWPQLQYYQGEVIYRVWVIPNGGGTPVLSAGSNTVHSRATGWDPVAQFGASTFNSTFPTDGPSVIEIEQSVGGSAWSLVGRGYLVSGTGANSPYAPTLVCGTP